MITTSIEAKELLAALQNLKSRDAKRAIRKGSRAAAKIVQAEAKRTAPRLTGTLSKNIKVRAIPRSRKYVGSTVKEVYPVAGFVEFGTKHAKGDHNIKEAFERVKDQAQTTFLETIKAEIEGMTHGD